MKKLGWRLIFSAVLFLVFIAMSAVQATAEKKIGILLWSEETRYTETRDGFMHQLKKSGFGEGQVKFTIENAGGNKAKAAEIAQKFANEKFDMVVAMGTSAAVPVAREIKNTPVVFGMVYDPVESKIAQSWESSGNNTTGASSKVPMSMLVSNVKKLVPVKKLAVLYTPGEKNSEAQLKEMEGVQDEAKIKVVPVPITGKGDVAPILSDVAGTVEAIYITGSNVVGAAIPTIVEVANKAKVVTVSHLEDIVEKGALVGVCANSYDVGVLAGEKAAKVLKGAKPSSIPIEPLKKLDVILNMKTVKAGQIQIPSDFLKSVTRKIE